MQNVLIYPKCTQTRPASFHIIYQQYLHLISRRNGHNVSVCHESAACSGLLVGRESVLPTVMRRREPQSPL